MILECALITLLLQATPAPRPSAAKASIAGVVLDDKTGTPLANVRVTLAKTDVPLGAFAQMMAWNRGPTEMTMSGEMIGELIGQMEHDMTSGQATPDLLSRSAGLKALPLADILEILMSPTGGNAVVFKSAPPVVTDELGKFSFSDVDAGRYKLVFSVNGYARRAYGQRTETGEGIPLLLGSGQTQTDIVMRMAQPGAVNGRICNESGQSAIGVPVQLVRFYYDSSGQKHVQRVAATLSDDRGEYRLYYLSPGRYYLSAGSEAGLTRLPGERNSAAGYSSPNAPRRNYALTYYPGGMDQNTAKAIDVQSGAEVQGIDMVVGPQQSYRVRGRVVDPATGQPPPALSISKTVEASEFGLGGGFDPSGNTNYKAADGTFELSNVGPGKYMVTATLPNRGQVVVMGQIVEPIPPSQELSNMSPAERTAFYESVTNADRARPRASARITVVNADVEGVVLTMSTSLSVSGRFRVDPSTSNATVAFGSLRAELEGAPTSGSITNIVSNRGVAADGTFRIDNVLPGQYRMLTPGLPPGYYVKEARLGSADVLNTRLLLSESNSSTVDILLSSNVGAISGAVLDALGKPVPGAQVVLMPARNRDRTDLFRPVIADSKGLFEIPSVVPGEYTLAAWEALEPYAFFAPEEITQAEATGKTLRVGESSSQAVSVTAIPVGTAHGL